MTDLFVVAMTVNGTDEKRYLYHDPDCGYIMSQTPRDGIRGASLFPTFDEARIHYDYILNAKPSVMSNGTVYPPTDIHNGLGINNARPSASGELLIEKVTTQVVLGSPVAGAINKPTGYSY